MDLLGLFYVKNLEWFAASLVLTYLVTI